MGVKKKQTESDADEQGEAQRERGRRGDALRPGRAANVREEGAGWTAMKSVSLASVVRAGFAGEW